VVIFVFLLIQYVSLFKNFSPNKSFLKIVSISPIGVIIIKKIVSITNGETTLPRSSPNFIQKKLKGLSNSGFTNDSNNNRIDMTRVEILIGLLFKIGHKEKIKKTTEKTSPKLFSEDLFINYFL